MAARVAVGLLAPAIGGAGCVSFHREIEPAIPVVALPQTPDGVRTAIVAVANGRRLEQITRVGRFSGAIFRAYIRDQPGTQLLTLDEHGRILDNAVAVRFEDLPAPVQAAARTVGGGTLRTCRQSIHRPGSAYVIDYVLGEEEPAYAVIETDGFVRGLFGYAEEDPD